MFYFEKHQKYVCFISASVDISLFLRKIEDMLVTTTEEIRAYVPTSVYSGNQSLVTVMEDTEENIVVPILGRELYDKVCEAYEKAMEDYGGVTSAYVDKEKLTPEIRLIRACQLPVVYLSLANSTGILTVSLNDGGGLNQVYTEGYDKADDKAVSRFERDAYFKGRRGVDRLLVFLEEDARSGSPVFADLWRKSRYFYLQGDLLFTTAIEMNRYLDIGESREKFIAMLPDIRYCQNAYIAPEIGEELTEALVKWCTRSLESDLFTGENKDAVNSVWQKAVDKLRMTLALYVESRRPEEQRKYSENEAAYAMTQARKYIATNQDLFGEFVKNSPLYVPLVEETQEADRRPPLFDNDDPDNAIFVFPPRGYNRH